jgi:hypothetical protein
MTPHQLSDDDFDRWYGAWAPLDPSRIGELMAGFDRPWWIVGGWSIEAFTGVPRGHEDLDVSILSDDATAFRLHLGETWTAWNVDEGWFRPFDARFPDVRPDSQLWLRRSATSPWALDVPLTPTTDGRWTNKRHPAHTEELDDVTWVADDGLRYARPEIALMFKARQDRAKDVRDAEVTLPMLDDRARRWLSTTIEQWDPAHPWVQGQHVGAPDPPGPAGGGRGPRGDGSSR